MMFSARNSRKSTSRSGFTVIELLVTLAVIGLLLALFLPVVQQSRETARRMQCANNLKQIATACHAHQSTHGHFPFTAVGYIDSNGMWRSGFSPHVRLLPFLEQRPLYLNIEFRQQADDVAGNPPRAWLVDPTAVPPVAECNKLALSTSVVVFQCPSDTVLPGASNYRGCLGAGPGLFPLQAAPACSDAGNATGVFVHGRAMRPAEVSDGLSNTAMFSERVVGDGAQQIYQAWSDVAEVWQPQCTVAQTRSNCASLVVANSPHDSFVGRTWLFGSWRQTWYNHVLTPNSSTPDCMFGGPGIQGGGDGAYSARSHHPGGVNLALCDGSVKFVNQSIDSMLWAAIATRSGKELLAFAGN